MDKKNDVKYSLSRADEDYTPAGGFTSLRFDLYAGDFWKKPMPDDSVCRTGTPARDLRLETHSTHPKFCSNCGKPLSKTHRYCGHCGKKINASR